MQTERFIAPLGGVFKKVSSGAGLVEEAGQWFDDVIRVLSSKLAAQKEGQSMFERLEFQAHLDWGQVLQNDISALLPKMAELQYICNRNGIKLDIAGFDHTEGEWVPIGSGKVRAPAVFIVVESGEPYQHAGLQQNDQNQAGKMHIVPTSAPDFQ